METNNTHGQVHAPINSTILSNIILLAIAYFHCHDVNYTLLIYKQFRVFFYLFCVSYQLSQYITKVSLTFCLKIGLNIAVKCVNVL